MKRGKRDEPVSVEKVIYLPNASLSFTVKEQADRRFRELAVREPQMIWEADESGVIWTNGCGIIGHRSETLHGLRCADFCHPDELEAHFRSFIEVQLHRQPWDRIFRLRDSAGAWQWVRSVAHPIGEAGLLGATTRLFPQLHEPMPFVSTCPHCAQPRVQNGYTRAGLLMYLQSGRTIDAYCSTCEVLWALSGEERHVLVDKVRA
jgi:PAS domain S-box-containing protein